MEVGSLVVFTETLKQPQLFALKAKVVNIPDNDTVDIEVALFGGKVTYFNVDKRDVTLAHVKQEDIGVSRRYLVTHPLRQGRLTLYQDSTVSFAHLGLGGILLDDCAKHGSWEVSNGKLVVYFHHQAKAPEMVNGKLWSYEKKHTYIQYNVGSDVWHLAGIISEQNAVESAVLEPWPEQQ